MEFIPEKDAESDNPDAIPLSDVKKGSRYEFVMTGSNGWYRYRTGDLLTFTDTDPYIVTQIARKGRTVNMAGEKLTEMHVLNAIESATAKTGARVMDYTVVGEINRSEGLPFYTLAAMFGNEVDPVEFVTAFEEHIKSNNMEFRIVRETGALGATQLRTMRMSLAEKVLKTTHVQAKPISLTTDPSVLELCEAT